MQKLVGRLGGLLHATGPEAGTVLRIGDLEIDPDARRVVRAGQEITLTRREFDTLEFLARQPGRIVSATRIHEHLYKDYTDLRSNTIAVYIRNLRRKIDRHFHPCLLHTRWRQGYMLRDV
jgi:two-component system response regulator MprA